MMEQAVDNEAWLPTLVTRQVVVVTQIQEIQGLDE
jgi:hypothetical protein